MKGLAALKSTMLVGSVIGSLAVSLPAAAQTRTVEERDAYFEACKADYMSRGFGGEDEAAAYCYPKAYEEEGFTPPPRDPPYTCQTQGGPYNCVRPQ